MGQMVGVKREHVHECLQTGSGRGGLDPESRAIFLQIPESCSLFLSFPESRALGKCF